MICSYLPYTNTSRIRMIEAPLLQKRQSSLIKNYGNFGKSMCAKVPSYLQASFYGSAAYSIARFAIQAKFDHEQVWVDLCVGINTAKAFCKTFLTEYVRHSEAYRPILGPEEWEKVRTINCAVTVEDVWAALVRVADEKVMQPKREADPEKRASWTLNFSSQNRNSRNVAVWEISQWIPKLAVKLGLSLKQTFDKQEATPEDTMRILNTVMTRAPDIPCSPDQRVAFSCVIILGGTGGWRPGSLVGMLYKDVEIALVRDSHEPSIFRPVANITIHHVKQRTNRIERHQRSRAIADNAFEGDFSSPNDILRFNQPVADGINWVPLKWKTDKLKARIIPISYHQYWEIWNRTLLVTGLRDNPRPYAMRVGAGGRLDGSLTPALRNYILSNSTGVFEASYHPKEVRENLMKISFGSLAGQSDDVLSLFRQACLKRDPHAPIYISQEDLDEFESRDDISTLRKLYQEEAATSPKAYNSDKAKKITARIQFIINKLEDEKIKDRRRVYFEEADKLRAQGKSTTHLHNYTDTNPRRKYHTESSAIAARVGAFLVDEEYCHSLADKLVAYLKGRPVEHASSKTEEVKSNNGTSDGSLRAQPRCLLCCVTFCNRSNLNRHIWDTHKGDFIRPFSCPECQRLGKGDVSIEAGLEPWSSHLNLPIIQLPAHT